MKNVTILLAVVAMMAGTMQADVILYEGFDYSGAAIQDTDQGGLGFDSTSHWEESGKSYCAGHVALSSDSASLTYPAGTDLTSSGKRVDDLNTSGSYHNSVHKLASGLITAGNTYYVSALGVRGESSSYESRVGFGNYNTEWDPTGGVDARCFFGIGGGSLFYLKVDGTLDSDGGSADIGETYFFVSKIVMGTGGAANKAYLKVYKVGTDTVGAEPENDAGWTLIATGGTPPDSYDYLSVLISKGRSSTGDQFDEIRVGTSWNDVTVPEPATMVLLGLGGLGVLIRRKRRA